MSATSRLAITTAILGERVDAGNPYARQVSVSPLAEKCMLSWRNNLSTSIDKFDHAERGNTPDDNLGVTGSLQWCYEHTTAPIIAFLHSDLEIFESSWDQRVLAEFDDPNVGVVGFGGALQLGEDDIYKKPYELHQLRRIGYMSNTNDAETHGSRFAGECDVATLDGFALIVRRKLLDHWKLGWPVAELPFHNYDNALCIEAHKQGYRVRLVGIKSHHHGGAVTTTPAYQEWSLSHLGKTDQQVHEESHRVLYKMGRGVLPWRVK